MSELFMYREKRKKRERPVMEMVAAEEEDREGEVEPEKQDVRERRTSQQRVKRVLATSKHLEQLTKQTRRLAGEEEDELEQQQQAQQEQEQEEVFEGNVLDAAKAGLLRLKERHARLRERLTSRKPARDQLQSEFDFAVLKSHEVELEGEAWNDLVMASLWERMQAEARFGSDVEVAGAGAVVLEPFSTEQKLAYRVDRRTVICGLSRQRIGIRFETSFGEETYESYYCAITCKNSSDKFSVCEHTVPFFLPLRETEKACLATSPKLFIGKLGGILQAYVSRRQQLSLLKDTRGDEVGEVYNSLPYNLLEFCLEIPDCKVGVTLAYDELLSELPSRSAVTAWPLYTQGHGAQKGRRGPKRGHNQVLSHHLQAAETALQRTYLHEAYDQIVADVQATLGSAMLMSPGML